MLVSLCNGFLSVFFPCECSMCGYYIKDFRYKFICPKCFSKIRPVVYSCRTCGKPFEINKQGECRECAKQKRHFVSVKAGGIYEGALRKLIHKYKFEGKKSLTKLLFKFIIERVNFDSIPDEVVPVPLSRESAAQRGYNQTSLIAKRLAGYLKTGYSEAVVKVRETLPQNKLERKARLKNLKGVFKPVKRLDNKSVLVVDDVYTTGATMNEMAKALLKAGASEVYGVVIARSN